MVDDANLTPFVGSIVYDKLDTFRCLLALIADFGVVLTDHLWASSRIQANLDERRFREALKLFQSTGEFGDGLN